jgi:RNA-binding protein
MKTLTPSERRALRAKAHHLHPVVSVGHHGLTPAVLHEIDVALLAHELVKIRAGSDTRDERNALLERICLELDAAPVQHLGKVLTVWRRAPEPAETESVVRSKRPVRKARRLPPAAPAPDKTKPVPRPRNAPAAATHAPRGGAATARRRRPSDVVATGVSGKRRPVAAGKAPATRKRAPATTKGAFEPGSRRPPRPGAAARPRTGLSTEGDGRRGGSAPRAGPAGARRRRTPR